MNLTHDRNFRRSQSDARENRPVSPNVVRRLPRYLRYLGDLMDEGAERVSSAELAARMGVTASQIRQDFNNFGGFGQQGYGYHISHLHAEISRILGLDHDYHIVIIGAGNLGCAIAKYENFVRRGFQVIGMFDEDTSLVGKTVRHLEVRPVSEMEDFFSKNHVDIVALTLPKEGAVTWAERVRDWGVFAIWNFAHVDLHDLEGLVVENVHLSDSLMALTYAMKEKQEEENP